MAGTKNIVLTTINARYIHSAFGLRYLYANMGELQPITSILEFDPTEQIQDMAEKILQTKPDIVGIGVYIWNASMVQDLIRVLKKVGPSVQLILGGPEVSHEPIRVNYEEADFIIRGEAEISFPSLCKQLLEGHRPEKRIVQSDPVTLDAIELPYFCYSDEDVTNRVIYIETSRGCPFQCEFCLSSIDKEIRYFNLDFILAALEELWNRGVRKFKFIDRTFNLDVDRVNRILDFFLEQVPPYLAHFEVIPDHIPENLKEKLKHFPPATIQFEIGIQTLDPKTAGNIHRKIDLERIEQNLRFLDKETHVHLHLGLIVGLPGETVRQLAENLNMLMDWTSGVIQIGILKKLSGTSIARHDVKYNMVYSDTPPYDILQNEQIPFNRMQQTKRLARYWDLVYNSGNFVNTVQLLWKDTDVFGGFEAFSEWLFGKTDSTWNISLNRLAEMLFTYLSDVKGQNKTDLADVLVQDLMRVEGRKVPPFLRKYVSITPEKKKELLKINKRQMMHDTS